MTLKQPSRFTTIAMVCALGLVTAALALIFWVGPDGGSTQNGRSAVDQQISQLKELAHRSTQSSESPARQQIGQRAETAPNDRGRQSSESAANRQIQQAKELAAPK